MKYGVLIALVIGVLFICTHHIICAYLAIGRSRGDRRARRKAWLRLTAFAVLGTAILAGLMSWLIWLPPNGENINRVSTDQKLIAITFDDGPNSPYTAEILNVLRHHGASATFFMTGEHIAAHPNLVARVIGLGHQVGNHGVDGKVLAFKNKAYIRERIAQVDAAIREAGFRGDIPFRAARGMQFLTVAAVLREQNRPHIGASAIGRDWIAGETANRIAKRLIKGAKPGAIFSLHDGNDASETVDRSATVEALKQVLAELGDDYRFVTIEELIRAGD